LSMLAMAPRMLLDESTSAAAADTPAVSAIANRALSTPPWEPILPERIFVKVRGDVFAHNACVCEGRRGGA
jgi:hypothetical protein